MRVQAPPERPAGLPPGAGRDVAGTAAPASSQNIAELDFSVVGITWRVHRGPSLPVYELHRLQDLRGFLSTGQITPADQLSHDGNRWVDIASITDLEAYFWSVWQMALNPGEVPTVLSSQHEASVERLESEVTERPTEAQAAWFNAQTILPMDQEAGPADGEPGRSEGSASGVPPAAARSFDLLGEQITGTSEAIVPLAASATPPPAEPRTGPEPVELEIAGEVDASEERTVTAHEAATEPTMPHRRRRSTGAAQPVSEAGSPAAIAEEESPLPPTAPIEVAPPPPVPVPSAPAPIPIPGAPGAAVASVAVPGGPPDPVAEGEPREPAPLPQAPRQAAPTVVPVQPPHLEEPGSHTAARPPAPLAMEEPGVGARIGVVGLEPSNVFTEGDLGLGEEDLDDPPRVGGTTTPPMEATVPRSGMAPAPLRRQPTESLRPSLLKGGPSAPVQVVAPQPPGAPRPAPRGGVGVVVRRRRPVWGRSASIMAAAFAGGVSLTIGAFTLALVIAAFFGFDPTSAPEQVVEGLTPHPEATEEVVTTAPGTAPTHSASPIPVVTPPVAPAPRRRAVRTPRPAAESRGATLSGVKPPDPSPRPDYAPDSSAAEAPPPLPAPDDEVLGLPSDLEEESAPVDDPSDGAPDPEPPGPLISRDGEPDAAPEPVPTGGVEVRELLPLKEEGSSSEAERAPSPVPAPEEE